MDRVTIFMMVKPTVAYANGNDDALFVEKTAFLSIRGNVGALCNHFWLKFGAQGGISDSTFRNDSFITTY
ncbi:hypothetical protein ASG93_09410 [Paenibacillus sp. Soil787]|nr:hypothetical protein ASG93_09410 [Paenibacillus sp. Soil787]